jgi:putative ABC transport system substrate-binding protein
MGKRVLVFGLSTLLFVFLPVAQAQNKPRIPRIGVLLLGAPPNANLDAFIEGLRDLRYRELVHLNVDAIFTASSPAIFALKAATQTIPIVFFGTSDPVGLGIVASLAHPGGNVTGITALASDLWPKRLELLKEIFPKLSRVAMLWNTGNPGMALEAKATSDVAKPLGITLQDRGVKNPNDLDVVFGVISKERPDGFLALMDPVLNSYQKRILDFVKQNHLPAIFETKTWVEAGGLISYGADYAGAHRRAAALMDKILKGTKPSEIPVEQPTKFELVINLKTAKEIGLTIPPNVLARADRVIR